MSAAVIQLADAPPDAVQTRDTPQGVRGRLIENRLIFW